MIVRSDIFCRYVYLIGDNDLEPDSVFVIFIEIGPEESRNFTGYTAFEDLNNVYFEANYLLTRSELREILRKGNLGFHKKSRDFEVIKSIEEN